MSELPDSLWDETERVMISALEHYAYCPRQCALIHVEQVFDENVFTVRGRLVHELVDEPDEELRGDVRIERAVPLWCNRLGLVGKADVVEFLPDGTPYPVEYKSGRRFRARGRASDVQLCAQALCLEEMLGRAVPRGAVFHHGSRRRREVEFTEELRTAVGDAVSGVRQLLASATLPPPLADKRCPNCSLIDVCMPDAVASAQMQGTTEALFDPVLYKQESG
jgi:CRISPR-associated exonuclease Cas4